MKIEWTEDLSVNVDEIDNQHKELFKRINDLRAAMSEGKGKEEIGRTVRFLSDYVVEHFKTEERHMDGRAYPDVNSHKTQHAMFIKDFTDFVMKLQTVEAQGGLASFLVVEMQRRLVDWLVNHIGKADKALGAYLAAKV